MITLSWQTLLAQSGITVLAALIAAYAAFRWLSVRWLEHKFSERLEAFKHAKNREIEELRGEVNALLDRTVKLHAKEFEILPHAWDKLHQAYGSARLVVSRGQQYPDVQWLEITELNALTDKLGLERHERDAIGSTARGFERQTALNKIIDRQRMVRAYDLQMEARNYLVANGLFMQPELKAKFRSLADFIWNALEERQFDREFPSPGETDRWKSADALSNEGHKLYEQIEIDVQNRLWDRKLLTEKTRT